MKIETVFSYNNGIFSKIIRFFTAGLFSHCGIIIYDEEKGGKYVIDAQVLKGVDSHRLEDWSKNRTVKILKIPVDPEKALKAQQWLLEQIGKKYDFLYLKSILNPFRKTPVFYDKPGNYYCNELLVLYLIKFGLNFLDKPWIRSTSPDDIYKILDSHFGE